jgi:Rad3-related DNA helicase
MAKQFAKQPGNYLAFFSSHDYLQQVASEFQAFHPEVPVWVQQRRMSEVDQQGFLDAFSDHGQGIAFAVLGGSFGEGIDLPGRRLIGAFIATMGLPQVNPVNERMRKKLDALGRYGDGYNAIYFYPGLQKVVQAAGRVIRTTTDRGVLHLMDQRYGRAEVQALLPGWWEGSPGVLAAL